MDEIEQIYSGEIYRPFLLYCERHHYKTMTDLARCRFDPVSYTHLEVYKRQVYVAQRSRFDKTRELDSEHRHLVLLCENNTGYQNLAAMVSKSWIEGFYSKPRVDLSLIHIYNRQLMLLGVFQTESADLSDRLDVHQFRGESLNERNQAGQL